MHARIKSPILRVDDHIGLGLTQLQAERVAKERRSSRECFTTQHAAQVILQNVENGYA